MNTPTTHRSDGGRHGGAGAPASHRRPVIISERVEPPGVPERDDTYHEGELSVQRRAGVRDEADRLAGMVTETVPDESDLRAMVADQPHAVVTSVDTDSRVWVSLLAGEPGFVRVVDDRTVRFDADPSPGDPLADHLRPGMPAGVLIVDPRTRNRLRLNGTVQPDDHGFTLTTREVFPNCPKYIQRRSFERVEDASAGVRETYDGLAATHREWIGETDTFFVGSYYPETGADASHRGGDPGFVDATGDTVAFPDYPGNNMFCTLGNVAAHSGVGLLFVDFETGRTLQATGHGAIVWDDQRVAAHDRAERFVEITVERAVELPDGNPLRWTLEERSPFNP